MPPADLTVFQLHLALLDVKPRVWRRLLVPGALRLSGLHRVMQAAMGWEDSHLHAFSIGDARYGPQYDDYPEDEIDERRVTVIKALDGYESFSYEYDFGDSWDHEVVVEARWTTDLGLKFAVCVDGKQACPPEDCGGAPGYAEMLQVLNDPSEERYDELREWLGGPFDPAAFDLAAVNAALQRLR